MTAILCACVGMAQQYIGLANPESLISDGKFLYATNIGKKLDPTAKDGDGSISKLTLDGRLIKTNITKEILHAPKGTAIISNILYVADIDRIVGIDLSTGKKVKEISLAGLKTVLVNDLAAKDEHTLFASLMDIGQIIEVDLRTGTQTFVADVKGANGICYDAKQGKLYTCSFVFEDMRGGEIGEISWKDNKPAYSRIGDLHGAFDGLAVADDHTLLVSDWGAMDHAAGTLLTVDLKTNIAAKIDLPLIGGPADFYFDAQKKKVFIPALLEAKVLIHSL